MTRQKMYSAIKIGGFALGIAACLLIALFIRDELSYDRHYPDNDRIFRVVVEYDDRGQTQKSVWFQAPFAAALKAEFPQVEKAGRYNASELFGAGSNEVRRADRQENSHEDRVTYADQELVDVLGIRMAYGDAKRALDEPNTVVISKRKADAYFPGENPVGKLLVFNNNTAKPYRVGGVMENFPANAHLQFDFLLTLKGMEFWPGEQQAWDATNYPTYVRLRPGTDAPALAAKLNAINQKYLVPLMVKQGVVDAQNLAQKTRFVLQPISDIHLYSHGIQDKLSHSDVKLVWLFGAIAGFILLLACINFVNLSTAKSANRAMEVGLRKVVGGDRRGLVSQFLAESLLFSFLSFAVGIGLAWLLLPMFNELAAKSLTIPFSEWWTLPVLAAAAVAVGLVAGLYPAFYLSAFRPIQVLKGSVSRGSKSGSMRSTLVIFQFATSIVLLIGTFIIQRQMGYILNKQVGFEKDQVLLLHGTHTLGEGVKTFKNELLRLPEVQSASISGFLPIQGTKRNGNSFWKEGKSKEEKSVSAQVWEVDHDYVKTLGLALREGRDFSAQLASDSDAVIINQAMAKQLALTRPVGARIMNWRSWNVIGVVENFHFESLKDSITPLCLQLRLSPSIVSVKVKTADMGRAIEAVSGVWKTFAPHQPIRYTFLDENFARMYDDVQRTGRIFTTFTVLAIVVACLGLFALSAFMVEQRGKEISIRLVLGASVSNIFGLLTFNFLKLVVISFVVAVPVGWYLMHKWLEDFVYRTKLGADVFLLAGLTAVAIAVFTISYQSIKAALMNPVKRLKSE